MPPEQNVTSLEWSKKLKEAGWPQEDSVFRWAIQKWGDYHVEPFVEYALVGEMWNPITQEPHHKTHTLIAAPTAEEILRRLPDCIEPDFRIFVDRRLPSKKWTVNYRTPIDALIPRKAKTMHEETSVTLANAAAAMWIYLKENSLLPDV